MSGLKYLSIPLVITNLNLDKLPRVKPYLQRSAVVSIGKNKVGILGFVDPRDKYDYFKFSVEPIFESLDQECQKLRKQGSY